MSEYNLAGVNLLLVEDNEFVQKSLRGILRAFKVGGVSVCANGTEAIEFLKKVPEGALDLLIADYVMTPIDGLLLLRWLRNSNDSPNRFMPVIMMSGAADLHVVNAARDMGATEFLAKPFSIQSISEHLLNAIAIPRQFIATRDYFGPDRRRQIAPTAPTKERRKTREEDITIVYSAKQVYRPVAPADVWHFQLANALKDKIGGLSGQGLAMIPLELLIEAEEHLQREALDFTDWAQDYLAELAALCDKALDGIGMRAPIFREINLLAHELRGQGGTFGYPLITEFAKMLYECTGQACPQADEDVEIVKAHIDAMRAVLRDKVAGTGGQIGLELLASLKLAIEKQMIAS